VFSVAIILRPNKRGCESNWLISNGSPAFGGVRLSEIPAAYEIAHLCQLIEHMVTRYLILYYPVNARLFYLGNNVKFLITKGRTLFFDGLIPKASRGARTSTAPWHFILGSACHRG
jgi:hypothetical protein